MSVVLLVRHGQASFGKKDYDALSPRGHVQARILGRSLAQRGVVPGVVVRGELRRHRETAEGVVAGLSDVLGEDHPSPDVHVDAGWDEFDFQHVVTALKPLYRSRLLMKADLAVRGVAEFQRIFEEATRRWVAGDNEEDYHEPFAMFAERVRQALRRSVEYADAPGDAGPGRPGPVLVVSSGGPIAVAASELLTGDTSLWEQLTTVAVNTGVTKVVSGRRGVTLSTYNEHAHLEHDRALLTYR